jgi:hypothetical protein
MDDLTRRVLTALGCLFVVVVATPVAWFVADKRMPILGLVVLACAVGVGLYALRRTPGWWRLIGLVAFVLSVASVTYVAVLIVQSW